MNHLIVSIASNVNVIEYEFMNTIDYDVLIHILYRYMIYGIY